MEDNQSLSPAEVHFKPARSRRRLGRWLGTGLVLVLIIAGALWIFVISRTPDKGGPLPTATIPTIQVGTGPLPTTPEPLPETPHGPDFSPTLTSDLTEVPDTGVDTGAESISISSHSGLTSGEKSSQSSPEFDRDSGLPGKRPTPPLPQKGDTSIEQEIAPGLRNQEETDRPGSTTASPPSPPVRNIQVPPVDPGVTMGDIITVTPEPARPPKRIRQLRLPDLPSETDLSFFAEKKISVLVEVDRYGRGTAQHIDFPPRTQKPLERVLRRAISEEIRKIDWGRGPESKLVSVDFVW